jgi:hypothetical protein
MKPISLRKGCPPPYASVESLTGEGSLLAVPTLVIALIFSVVGYEC